MNGKKQLRKDKMFPLSSISSSEGPQRGNDDEDAEQRWKGHLHGEGLFWPVAVRVKASKAWQSSEHLTPEGMGWSLQQGRV